MMKLALLCGCLMLLDCGRGPTSATPSPRPEAARPSATAQNSPTPDTFKPSDVLMKISFDGGLVPDRSKLTGGHTGHVEFAITRAGNYSWSGDVTPKKKGVLSRVDLDELVQQMDAADFVQLKSKKFTGQCPTAYDGEEATYTFVTPKGIEVLASCTIAIDEKSALFMKVWEIQEKCRQ